MTSTGQSTWRQPLHHHHEAQVTGQTINLWRIDMLALEPMMSALRSLLNPAELDRCGAYRFAHLQRRYIIRHAVLKLILAQYLCCEAGALEVSSAEFRKPVLTNPRSPLRFNLSDSEETAVVAVSWEREVGVDVEHVRRDRPPLEILPQLAPPEREAIAAAPAGQQADLLYRVWVRKEAYIKALGHGLGIPLDGFSVPIGPQACFEIHEIGKSAESAAAWTGHDFEPGDGCMGCVVCEGGPCELRFWDAAPAWVRERQAQKCA